MVITREILIGKMPFVIESDLDFIKRLLEREGTAHYLVYNITFTPKNTDIGIRVSRTGNEHINIDSVLKETERAFVNFLHTRAMPYGMRSINTTVDGFVDWYEDEIYGITRW